MLLLLQLYMFACFLMPAKGEVGNDFSKCNQFFFDNKPPDESLTPANPARICQVYKNVYRFATMYDRKNRIPIFSAYKCKPGKGPRPEDWMIEPQLVDSNFQKSMEDERETTIPKDKLKASQAIFEDYSVAPPNIDKGHLNPVVHQPNEDSKAATSTLTNIVPQFNKLNQGAWVKYENAMKDKAATCTVNMFVIVGVVPGNNFISDGRVNKPSHIWSAICCVKAQGKESLGFLAQNDENKVVEYTLENLQKELARLYGKQKIELFSNSCQ